jgi:phosphoribosylglycinamide formyltransferase 1
LHHLNPSFDSGPVILQRAVELPDASAPDEVLAALRPLEHELLPRAVALFARHALGSDPDNPRRTIVAGAAGEPASRRDHAAIRTGEG